MPNILEGLTDEQLAAAMHIDGPAACVAGPGAGKTQTSVKRVAYMLEQKIPAERILFTTFSKKAAGQLKDRALNIAGNAAHGVKMTTLHSLGYSILKQRRFVNASETNIVKRWQQLKFLRDYYYNRRIKKKSKDIDQILQRISESKSQLLTPDTVDDREFAEVWSRYEKWKTESNLIEFDDMVWLVATQLSDDPSLGDMFDYILVDEFQDVDMPQLVMLQLLAQKKGNVFVIGDWRQSIYEWRGANASVWTKFFERWPDAKTFFLTRNFRSLPKIVDMGNCIASEMIVVDRLRCELKPVREGDAVIDVYPDIESAFTHMVRLHDEGTEWHEIAVLARINVSLAKWEKHLRDEQIPYRISAKDSIFKRREVVTVFALARIMEDHRDTQALEEFLRSTHPWKMFLPNHYVDALLAGTPDDPVEELGVDFGNPRAAEIAQRCKSNILRYERATMGASLKDRIAHIVNAIDTRTMIEDIVLQTSDEDRGSHGYDQEVNDRMDVLRQLIEFAEDYKHAADMQEDLSAGIRDENKDDDESAVQLSSVHSAKGLEWDAVFITDAVDGKMPRNQPDTNTEEEKRIAFVAVTRARNQLFFVHDGEEDVSVLLRSSMEEEE